MLRDMLASKAIAACFSDAALVEGMLAFERGLAVAEAACGIVPRSAADAIESASRSTSFDFDALAGEARTAGTLAIPLVKRLTEHVAGHDPEAARYVHWGATSQDVQDTATALAIRRASERLALDVERIGDALARLVEAHRATPMAARTLLQIAAPVPFGWKAAVWLDAVARVRSELARAAREAAVLQFGGATGVRASLGSQGEAVAQALSQALQLPLPDVAWHAIRDRIARLGAELGVACGVLAKIAGDVALLMQSEVGEAFEPAGEGRGGSSAMPHKRNPVGAMLAREAAIRAPALVGTLVAEIAGEHERGLGQWQGQFWTLGELFMATGSAAEAMVEALEGLTIDAGAMQRNLEAMHGLVYAEALSMALAQSLGKSAAHARVEALSKRAQRERKTLRQALEQDAELAALVPEAERDRLFSPWSQFGSADAMIDRALAAWRNRGG